MMNDIQGVTDKFNKETYLEARKLAQKIVLLTASQFDIGMTSKDGEKILSELCDNFGVERLWHPHKFRVGTDTTKPFRKKSDPEIKLQNNDIYFMDIGIVINGHEADYGQTFTCGQNLEYAHCQKSVREVFREVQNLWKDEGLTGEDLYLKATSIAKSKGYELNLDMDGHRLGDYPHGIFYKGSLSKFEKMPIENLWVLEILIRHPEKEFGAFFEDILIKD
jgi:Xaa-Pro aminopeptidase